MQFDIQIDKSQLATNDIRYFYKEMGANQIFSMRARVTGALNDLTMKGLRLTDSKNSQIYGDVNFKNLFGKDHQRFYMKGNFDKVSSNYDNLVKLLPNVLGKKLPSSLKKIGQFNLRGKAEISATAIAADFYMATQLGNIQSNLEINDLDNIDNAQYRGNIILEEFNIGAFLNRKDVGKVTLNVDVDGKGFHPEKPQYFILRRYLQSVLQRLQLHQDYCRRELQEPGFQGQGVCQRPEFVYGF